MSAENLEALGPVPSWVLAIDRARHIIDRNLIEAGQIVLLVLVGGWLVLPGASWSPIVTEDFRLLGLEESPVGLLLQALGSAHAWFLWRRWYCLRKLCAGGASIFWFCYACASFHAAPLDVLSPMVAAQSLFSAFTFWRLKAR